MNRSLERNFERFARRGDAKALTRVFDRTARDLLTLAEHLVQHSSDAEDLVQSTFVTAIDRASSFDGKQRLKPWLTGILCNHAANLIRRRQSRGGKVESLDSERHAIPSASDGPLTSITQAELLQQLQHALRKLPQRYRRVLEPYLIQGERPEQIARTLNEAPGTVRTQIHRGLIKLRRFLPVGALLGSLTQTRGMASVRSTVIQHAGLSASLTPPSTSLPFVSSSVIGFWSTALVIVAACVVFATNLSRGETVGENTSLLPPQALSPAIALDSTIPRPSELNAEAPSASFIAQREVRQLAGEASLANNSSGRLLLQGALSWVPDEARGTLHFNLVCPKKDNDGVTPEGNAPLKTKVLEDVQLKEDGCYEIDVSEEIRLCGEPYSLSVLGTGFEMNSREFIFSDEEMQTTTYGQDVCKTVLPGKARTAGLVGSIAEGADWGPKHVPLDQVEDIEHRTQGKIRAIRVLDNAATAEEIGAALELTNVKVVNTSGWVMTGENVAVVTGGSNWRRGSSLSGFSADYRLERGISGPIQVRSLDLKPSIFREGETYPVARGSLYPNRSNNQWFLTSHEEGDFKLVVTGNGIPPATQAVSIRFGEKRSLASPIETPSSSALSGHLKSYEGFGNRSIPLVARRIIGPSQKPFVFERKQYVWEHGQLKTYEVKTRTDSSGNFEFRGLSLGTYQIVLDPDRSGSELHSCTLFATEAQFQTPTFGAKLSIKAARLNLHLPSIKDLPEHTSLRGFSIQQCEEAKGSNTRQSRIMIRPGGIRCLLVAPKQAFRILYSKADGTSKVLWTGSSGETGSQTEVDLPSTFRD